MPLPTNQQLRDTREEHCFAITPERKYYRDGQTFIKRSLKPSEWQKHNGYMHIPLFNPERILNEGACIRYLAKHTNIPLPRVYACFEDDCAAYIITEYIEGVSISDLDDAQQKIVAKELETHLHTLKQLTSNTWGGPTGVVRPHSHLPLFP